MKLSEEGKKKIGEFLRKCRESKKLSMVAVGETKGIHPQYLWNVERGRCAVSEETIKTYQEVCKIPKTKLVNTLKKIYAEEIEHRFAC